MRNLKDLMEVSKEDLPSIYCDMDMVLCDFLKGAEKVIGMPSKEDGRRYLERKTFGRT